MGESLRPPQPLYFETDFGPAFGWHYEPAAPACDLCVVMCPPIGSELMCSYFPLRELAKAIARAGVGVLRIDYQGTGDSSGYDDDPDRVAAWLNTIDKAIARARALGYARVGLYGHRLGATLAAVVGARRGDVACAVLWAPCKTGKAFTREMKMLAQAEAPVIGAPAPGSAGAATAAADAPDAGTIEAGGFLLAPATIADLGKLDLGKLGKPVAPRALVIGRDDVAGIDKIAAGLGAEFVDWPGYAKMMLSPHHAKPAPETFAKIAAWFRDGAANVNTVVNSVDNIADIAAEPAVDLPGGVRERAIRFGPDRRLVGILTEPATAGSAAVVLANTGANYHVGPNRMYVRMARDWAARGFTVLRFDLGGIGESPPRPGLAPNVPYQTEGALDLELAVAEARTRTAAREVISVGLCSGAYYSFHAGLRGTQLDAQILVNPQTFYWHDGDGLDAAPAVVVERVQAYKARARSWASWKKLLTGRANYRVLLRTAWHRAYDLGEVRLKRIGARLGVYQLAEDLARDLRAISDRGIATLMVYSEHDAGIVYLEQRVPGGLDTVARTQHFTVETIRNADHTFSNQAAQRRLIAVMTAYLASRP